MKEKNNNLPLESEQEKISLPAEEAETMEINLVDLMYRLIEKAKYIVIAAIIGGLLAWCYTQFYVTPMYSATSKLYVLNSQDSAINLSDLQVGTYLAADYQEVFKNWHVHEMVIQDLNLPYSYKQLSDMLDISNPKDTRVLYIKVTAPDPNEAKAIADSYAKVAREFIAAAMETEEPNLFEEALLPTSASSPNKTRNTLLGFILGFVLCAGVITVKFIMDDRIRNSEDIERCIGIPTLGVMPLQKNEDKRKARAKRGVSV